MKMWTLFGALAMATVWGSPTSASPVADIDREPNDTFTTAVPVRPPSVTGSGCINPAGDVDFYSFTLTEPTPLFIGARAKGGARFNITVFDGKRQPLAKGDDMVEVPSVDAGDYFLRISGMQKDCYDLQLFAETRLPPFG